MIEISEFDESTAHQVFHSWLERDQRRLTSLQMEWLKPKLTPRVEYGIEMPTPLFLSLIYEFTYTWHSFDDNLDSGFEKAKTTKSAIKYLYARLSEKYGEVLFYRAMKYLKQAGGLSETELEDMLSADNEVLHSVFVHYLPPTDVFRLPGTLWIRIRNDMSKYLVEKNVDNVPVIYFYHRSFQDYDEFGRDDTRKVEVIRRAYYAGNVGHFLNLHDLPFEITSEKLIKMHRSSSLRVNRCLNRQQAYVKNIKGKDRIYNMRRINQLFMHMSDLCCEPWFLYDYNFISSYLHCYKISDLRASSWFYPTLRFLLTQYEACSFVLDKHPDNFAFDLSARLGSLVDILPEIIFKLFYQCLSHCALFMVENETPSPDLCMSKYVVGIVSTIGLDRDSGNLLVLLAEKLLSFHLEEFYLTSKIDEYELPSKEFTSLKYSESYICLYSTKHLLVMQCGQSKKCVLKLSIEDLIHVEFIKMGTLLVCSKGSKLVKVWDCLKETPIGQHPFDEAIIQCSTIKHDSGVVIKVTLETGITHYLLANVTKSNEENEVHFTHVGILKEKLGNDSILFNSETDVYYTEHQTSIYLYHFNRSENDHFKEIDNLPPMNGTVSLHNFFVNNKSDSALIWLTVDSAVILHSCGNHFNICGEYYAVCRTTGTFVGEFVCLINRSALEIYIFEWKCESGIHMYRLHARFQLDNKISHCVCNIGKSC
ncbi:unnamed protein product [Rotaria magnacalcarata]|nr:unnamed protein product [Rotaria magnacalcarata]CAF3851535.1 unnamed protein product [Rotaria magnacalcarata]CAF3857707.1 unnamed protein product [Rotaria magnacalcarata]CAF3870207.1 unnamed protein product [Rotaria magnacalcarata]